MDIAKNLRLDLCTDHECLNDHHLTAGILLKPFNPETASAGYN